MEIIPPHNWGIMEYIPYKPGKTTFHGPVFFAHVVHIVRICLVGDIRPQTPAVKRTRPSQSWSRRKRWTIRKVCELVHKPFTSYLEDKSSQRTLVEAWLLMALDGCWWYILHTVSVYGYNRNSAPPGMVEPQLNTGINCQSLTIVIVGFLNHQHYWYIIIWIYPSTQDSSHHQDDITCLQVCNVKFPICRWWSSY